MRIRTFLVLLLLSPCSAAPARAASPLTFLLFPPENLTRSPGLGWISEALAVSISDQIRVPGVESIGRDERAGSVETADLPPNAALSQASMIHVAQQMSADRLITGSYTGSESNLRIVLRVMDVKALKLGGEIIANGPLDALPQMENELAWIILRNAGLVQANSREQFKDRTRTVPNAAFMPFVLGLSRPDPEERIALLLKAVESYGKFAEAHYLLGRHYHRLGNCAETIRHLSLAGNRRQSYLEDQFILGNCHLKQNDPSPAIRCYSTILSFTRSSQVLNNAGIAQLRKGDYTLAAQDLVEAKNLAPTDPTIGMNLAVVRHLQGLEAAARVLLEEVESSHPNRGLVRFLLSVVFRAQGEPEKADAWLEMARRSGADPEKLSLEDPRDWVRAFTSWGGKP